MRIANRKVHRGHTSNSTHAKSNADIRNYGMVKVRVNDTTPGDYLNLHQELGGPDEPRQTSGSGVSNDF